jgi:protease-4
MTFGRSLACLGGLLALSLLTHPVLAEEPLKSATVAHIKLSGSPGEGPVADPLFGGGTETFKAKLDRIKKARDDKEVRALYLQIDGLGVGWGKVDELRRAIHNFRTAGKKAFAYLDSIDGMGEYLVACACDEVCVPESGWVMLTGLRMEVMFYKDLLDKLGVKADMLQMGAFKGAAEPMSRSTMSKELRSQYEKLLDDTYDNEVVGGIVESRPAKKWTAEQVKKLIDAGPYTARAAKEAGLIDCIAYADGFEDGVKGTLKAEKLKLSKNYGETKAEKFDFTNPLDLWKLVSPSTASGSSKPKVAVIYATGAIMTGKGGGGLLDGETCGSETLVEAIRQAEQDKTVKAIVLRVDSPGGSALASDLIWKELKRCKKPVIASMSDVAASGGYYISMGASKVYAEPGTLTGSIGVVGGKVALADLEKKAGINTEVISRGANSGILSMSTPFSDSERKAMTALMREVYDQFLDRVVDNRTKSGVKLTKERLEKDLAGGRVWTGRQAKELGLVDELGTMSDAVTAAWHAAGQKPDAEPDLLLLPRPRDLLERLMGLREDTGLSLVGLKQLPGIGPKLGPVETLLRLRGEPVWVLLPHPITIR